MDIIAIKKLWAKFDRGDRISKIYDLQLLLAHVTAGVQYLEGRGEVLALFKARVDRNRLEDLIKARLEKGKR